MRQTTIYDYLGIENDPIFNKINDLQHGQVVDLGVVKISLNLKGMYEIETELTHECFSSKSQSYDSVSHFLSLVVW